MNSPKIFLGPSWVTLAVHNHTQQRGILMATKTPYYNDELPTLRVPWALKVSDFDELLLVSAMRALNMTTVRQIFLAI